MSLSILNWLEERVVMRSQSARPAPKALEAGLADYLEMPITGRIQLARVNFLIEEGARRLFISDQTGTLYIVDKNTRRPSCCRRV